MEQLGRSLLREQSMASIDDLSSSGNGSRFRGATAYAIELVVIGAIYYVLAKTSLGLASINPNATPIWPPTGLALALILLRGYRIWPAFLIAAFAVNATVIAGSAIHTTTATMLVTSLAIGLGNTLEAVFGAYLLNRWSDGRNTFDTPAGVARFAALSFVPTALAASIGVTSLALAGLAEWSALGSVWLTWWLGDLAGALVIAPVVVLSAAHGWPPLRRADLMESILIVAGACVVGLIAFSPLFEHSDSRAPLGFLAVLPLLWSALRGSQRDTATVALILAGFAVWGTLAGSGPFGRDTLNESFLTLLMFMIGVTVPSLALSADVAARQRTEAELRATRDELNRRVEARTAALTDANRALEEEIERRKRVQEELDQQTHHLTEAQRLANLGSWVRDFDTGEIVWSEQLYKIFGMAEGEQFGGTFDGYLSHLVSA